MLKLYRTPPRVNLIRAKESATAQKTSRDLGALCQEPMVKTKCIFLIRSQLHMCGEKLEQAVRAVFWGKERIYKFLFNFTVF